MKQILLLALLGIFISINSLNAQCSCPSSSRFVIVTQSPANNSFPQQVYSQQQAANDQSVLQNQQNQQVINNGQIAISNNRSQKALNTIIVIREAINTISDGVRVFQQIKPPRYSQQQGNIQVPQYFPSPSQGDGYIRYN